MQASYEEVEEILENIFASRLKTVSTKNLAIWVKEICIKNYYLESLEKGKNYIVANDDVLLTIASVIKIFNDYQKEILPKLPEPKDFYICHFCENTGIAKYILKFETNGTFQSHNYAMKCVCTKANRKTDLLQFIKNDMHNKTELRDCYFKAFDDYFKKEFYLAQVQNNGNKDLKIDFTCTEFQKYKKRLGIVG